MHARHLQSQALAQRELQTTFAQLFLNESEQEKWVNVVLG
jgi:hypothetical protein